MGAAAIQHVDEASRADPVQHATAGMLTDIRSASRTVTTPWKQRSKSCGA